MSPGVLGATLTALMIACSATRPPATTTASPALPASPADDTLLAADAGNYTAFFISDTGAPPGTSTFREEAWEMFGANLLDGDSAGVIGVDRQRPVVLSYPIVDGARLRELLADPHAPAKNAPFAICMLLVVPVVDPTRAAAALDVLMRDSVCARPRGNAARWAGLLARLQDPDDRRAAETSDAAYLCMTDRGGIVVRVNAARRELRWTNASGFGSLLAAAAAPVKPARELGDRLQREGFFAARVSLYKMPAEDARAATALGLIKTMAGIIGLDPSQRDRIWQKGAGEVSAALRLIDSPPVLFSGLLGVEGVVSWTLTEEGRKFFSSLPVGRVTSAKTLKEAIAKALKPGGVFTDAPRFCDEVHRAGSSAEMAIRHTLWPHIVAFSAAHPGLRPIPATDFDNDDGQVEIDVQAGRVRLRPSRAP